MSNQQCGNEDFCKEVLSKISERLSLEDWKRASSKDIPNGLQDTQFLINQKYCLFMFARNEKCYISIFLKDSLIEVAAFEMNIEEYYDDVISETNAAEMLMHEEENQELSVFLDEVLNSEEDTNYYALWIYYWEELLGESAPTRYVA